MAPRLTDDQIRSYIIAFHRHDTDKDGFITRDQLQNWLDDVELTTDPVQVAETLDALDLTNKPIDKTGALQMAKALLGAASRPQTANPIGNLAQIIGAQKGKVNNWIAAAQNKGTSRPATAEGGAPAKPKADPGVIVEINDGTESDFEYYSYSDSDGESTTAAASAATSRKGSNEKLFPGEPVRTASLAIPQSDGPGPALPKPMPPPGNRVTKEKPNRHRGRNKPKNPDAPKMNPLADPKVRRQLASMKTHKPHFLQLMTIIHIMVLIYEIYMNGGFAPITVNPFGGPSGLTLIQAGAKYGPCMRDTDIPDTYVRCDKGYPKSWPMAVNGSCLYYDNLRYICGLGGFKSRTKPDQNFRFITPIFLHTGVMHLILNLIIQTRAGFHMETQLGSLRLAVIYFLSGIGGNIFAAALSPNDVSVGASSALYGLFAILYLDLIQNWPLLKRPWKDCGYLTLGVFIAIAVGFLPFIDNYAHIGGFISGGLSGIVFMPKIAFGKWDRTRKIVLMLAAAPALVLMFVLTLNSFYANTNSCEWCKYLDCFPPNAAWCAETS